MVYAENLCESQKVMRSQLIFEEFEHNITNIAGFDNILADTLSRLPYTPFHKYKPMSSKAQCCANELFVIGR